MVLPAVGRIVLSPDASQVRRWTAVTYGVEVTRTIMLQGWEWDVLGQSIAGLVVLGAIAVILMKRATEARSR